MMNNISYFIQGDEESELDVEYVSAEEVIFKDDDSFKKENCNPSMYTNLLQRAEDLSKHIKTLLAEAFMIDNKSHWEESSIYDLSSDEEINQSSASELNTNGKFIESYSSMLGKNLPIRKI